MSQGQRLRFLVLADLHAYREGTGDREPSSIRLSGDDAEAGAIFQQCLEALQAANIESLDAILCAGDLVDKADPESLRRVWTLLNALADKLGARLIATVGNHDVDSRGVYGVDPRETLVGLSPHFPSGTERAQLQYFTHYFCVEQIRDARLVILNSAAHHGLGYNYKDEARDDAKHPEHDHGRVTLATVTKVKRALRASDSNQLGVLLTHHHPVQLPEHDATEASQMVDAQPLLESLSEDGQWLVVHGHKHRPYLHYAPGGAGAPVIFSAGSMGATMDGEWEQAVQNQFFVLELLGADEAEALGLGMAGLVHAWTWDPWGDSKWRLAVDTDHFPARSGFGWRIDPTTLSRQIMGWLSSKPAGATWEELELQFPALPFLVPSDIRRTLRKLEEDSACVISKNPAGGIEHISLSSIVTGAGS